MSKKYRGTATGLVFMFAIQLKESAELFCIGAKLAIVLKQLVPQVIMAVKPLLKSSIIGAT